MINPEERKKDLENSLMSFRLKYLYEYFKVQLALVTGTIVILLGFYANIDNPLGEGSLKISLFGLGLATISQMIIHLQIYMRMHSIWYFKPDTEDTSNMFNILFTVNLLATIGGLSVGYWFIISNV